MEGNQVVPEVDISILIKHPTCKTVPNGKRGRPGRSVCTICYDYILLFDEKTEGETPALQPIVALKCGHLFHTLCINGWFKTIRKKELKPCPFCLHKMRSNDIKRIFPVSFGEEPETVK